MNINPATVSVEVEITHNDDSRERLTFDNPHNITFTLVEALEFVMDKNSTYCATCHEATTKEWQADDDSTSGLCPSCWSDVMQTR